ncbi:retroviral-like aspartic protease family protein [Sphingobium aromaticiconvertens]|uniref:retroviral-like aspartic protease family protein n=1 Tax=Sphingobium aromaticiconvertens TaxID=365341 RepID=UPI00301984C3
MRCVAAVAAFLAFWPGLLLAQEDAGLDPDTPPAVVRTGPASDDRLTIPIRIGVQGTWNFVIDTGAQRTVISRDLAQRLALVEARRVTILSMTGRSDVGSVDLPPIAFGTTTIKDIEAPVLDGDHLGAPGLLGLDGLQSKRLLLNFRTGRMEISASNRRVRPESDAIIVEARRRNGQLILLDSTVEGSRVNIILDTGTNISVGNMALLAKLTKKGRAPATTPASLTSVTGGVLIGQIAILRTVKMGGATLVDLPVLFAEASPFEELDLHDRPALLLGINALKVFDRVAIDFGRGKVDFMIPDQGSLAGAQLADARGGVDMP